MKISLYKITVIGLFLFILLSISYMLRDVKNDIDNMKNIKTIQSAIKSIAKNSKIVLQLQRERGLTTIYYANQSSVHLNKMLSQREETNKAVDATSKELYQSLSDIRNIVVSKKDSEIVFFSYSELIKSLLQDTKSLTFKTNNKTLKNELMIYNDLNRIQETLGNIRAKVGLILSSRAVIKEHIQEIDRRITLFYHELETIFSNDIIVSSEYAKSISKTKCLKEALLITKNIEEGLSTSYVDLSALMWFDLSTCAVDKISSLVSQQLKNIQEHIQKDIQTANKERVRYITFWLFGSIILAILIFISFKKSKEVLNEHALLENYKKAIDYSALVSKSDKDEIITYVNENFCVISGYTREELLGNKLDFIRDPDTPKQVSINISSSLDAGEQWHGILKNRKKNGTIYWVDTSITPIYDNENNLVEYIAIKHDISDIMLLNDEIQETQRELIYRLGEAVESRSKESGNHIKRVALYSKRLAQLANLFDEECEMVFAASSMHDIGKVAIADSILLKPAKLTPDEWSTMKTHSLIGYNLFKDSSRELLRTAADIAYEHHEHYNGKGYPRGIKGNEISIYGRIVAIADVFDALSSVRVYKDAWSIEKIVAFFKEESGKQFDPDLMRLFLDNLDEFVEIRNKH